MKKVNLLIAFIAICSVAAYAQPKKIASTINLLASQPAKVDFNAYEKLVKEVSQYRKGRLVNLFKFLSLSKEPNTIILDTRSAEMYKRKHVKGAINLNFSDFTQQNLALLIPSPDTKILIYCNNNFTDDQIRFATKWAVPQLVNKKALTLALNIPTFINLYGYGYKNVYELSDLISVFSGAIEFEGTDVKKEDSIPATASTPATTTVSN